MFDKRYPPIGGESFAQSYWLRDAIAALAKRDPVDALRDADALLLICSRRCKEVERLNGSGDGQ